MKHLDNIKINLYAFKCTFVLNFQHFKNLVLKKHDYYYYLSFLKIVACNTADISIKYIFVFILPRKIVNFAYVKASLICERKKNDQIGSKNVCNVRLPNGHIFAW